MTRETKIEYIKCGSILALIAFIAICGKISNYYSTEIMEHRLREVHAEYFDKVFDLAWGGLIYEKRKLAPLPTESAFRILDMRKQTVEDIIIHLAVLKEFSDVISTNTKSTTIKELNKNRLKVEAKVSETIRDYNIIVQHQINYNGFWYDRGFSNSLKHKTVLNNPFVKQEEIKEEKKEKPIDNSSNLF